MKRIRKAAMVSHVNTSFTDGSTKSLVLSRQTNGQVIGYVQSRTAGTGIAIANSSTIVNEHKSRINRK